MLTVPHTSLHEHSSFVNPLYETTPPDSTLHESALQESEEETLPLLDPWWDLYLPARNGERARVLAALAFIDSDVPREARGNFLAVGARALFVLGSHAEAGRLAERAIALGGEEASALATFSHPLGERFAEERVATGRTPGLRADAACDLAALRLRRGNVDAARAALRDAAHACPDHAETARWRRFFEDCRDPAGVLRRQGVQDVRKAIPATRDGLDLASNRTAGWVSAERLRRRVVTPLLRDPPARCGLGRLSEAGITTFWLVSEAELRRSATQAPGVALELLADALLSLVHEGRPALQAARTLWQDASATDARVDCAAFVLALATAAPDLAPFAGELAGLQARRHPEATAWRVWQAFFTVEEDEAGYALASREVAAPGADLLRWRLSAEILRRRGAIPVLRRLAFGLQDHPLVGPTARDILRDPSRPLGPIPPTPRIGRSRTTSPAGRPGAHRSGNQRREASVSR